MELNGDTSLIKWLTIGTRQITTYLNQQLEPLGLNASQYMYLLTVANNPGISQDQLLQTAYLNQSNVARGVNQLVKAGLFIKTRDLADGRRTILNLTPKGKEVYPEVLLIIQQLDDHLEQIAKKETTDLQRGELVSLLKAMSFQLKQEKVNQSNRESED